MEVAFDCENTAIKDLLYLLHNVWNNNFGFHTSRNKIIKKIYKQSMNI